jgi:hypothetical protein
VPIFILIHVYPTSIASIAIHRKLLFPGIDFTDRSVRWVRNGYREKELTSTMGNEIALPPPSFKAANPGPLGLAGFGLTTVVLSCVNAGILPPAAVAAVVPLAFAYGGVAQIIAGILEFKTGNTFGMVAFTSYGVFWWWFAFMKWTVGAGWLQTPPASAVAVTLLMWGVFTLLLWVVSFP